MTLSSSRRRAGHVAGRFDRSSTQAGGFVSRDTAERQPETLSLPATEKRRARLFMFSVDTGLTINIYFDMQ